MILQPDTCPSMWYLAPHSKHAHAWPIMISALHIQHGTPLDSSSSSWGAIDCATFSGIKDCISPPLRTNIANPRPQANNTTIRISRNREDASEASPRPIKYSLTESNQLIVTDSSIVELYYYDAILDTEVGKIEIVDDSNIILGKSIFNVYSLNYELFNIYDGKLNLY